MNDHILFFIFLIFSVFSCGSPKTLQKGKQKYNQKGKKKHNDKKNAPQKAISYSATLPGKTEILLNAQPKDMEKYINDKEGGEELVDEIIKALEKKKHANSNMNKYKHWIDYIDEKQ